MSKALTRLKRWEVGTKLPQTWIFSVCARLKDGHTFSTLLHASKEQLDRSFHSGPVVSMGMHKVSQDLDCVHLKGFVHNSTQILLGSLKRVLPENQMTDAGEIMQTRTYHKPIQANTYEYFKKKISQCIPIQTTMPIIDKYIPDAIKVIADYADR